MRKKLLTALFLAVTAMTAAGQVSWLSQVEDLMDKGDFKKAEALMKALPKKTRVEQEVRIDSLMTIMERIRKDFNMTPDDGLKLIREKMPSVTNEQLAKWKRNRKIEYMTIDGQEWWFRKSVRNLWLLADELKEDQDAEKWETYNIRRKYYLEAMKSPADENGLRDWRHMNITFT
ncbi:MAG: hypothetical protein IJK68_05100, partial [Muribaculaceae bacterium]|nr:hypothetical protein [Muribaculaceae bacterium]